MKQPILCDFALKCRDSHLLCVRVRHLHKAFAGRNRVGGKKCLDAEQSFVADGCGFDGRTVLEHRCDRSHTAIEEIDVLDRRALPMKYLVRGGRDGMKIRPDTVKNVCR